ncbi:pimeloyl-ACP methyl ester carboxylesterase [Allocatelliglobosispora scoriae]|uniref:Pimeloyl-ACP methyl ester carboxylesterase n=1 Tax=Allocatelliglobosispora scoriae TaxID=643052 RepID=A0A841BKG9_9ACTN|nr:alpha/beta fold hydrolase [Allocatelliglobosispora scoriae]MBB5867726.1 pimeloyl-ACP methyl ester carboxylesterase [Allocatelliglobosispora scoriae]
MELVGVPTPAGGTVSCRTWPGQTRPFVLVHGLASNARLWDEVADELSAAGHPVWAVDLPGHGATELPPTGVDTASAARAVTAVIQAHLLAGAVVAGQSWGGNVAVRLTADRPELVGALALVDGGWIDLPADFGTWDECAEALRPADLHGLRADDLRDRLRQSHPDWSDRAVEATVASLRELPDGTVERRLPIPAHLAIVRDMWDHPPGPWLARITAPTLLLPAIPQDHARAERTRRRVAAAADLLLDNTIREYADSDHDLHAQRPRELATDLLGLARR